MSAVVGTRVGGEHEVMHELGGAVLNDSSKADGVVLKGFPD